MEISKGGVNINGVGEKEWKAVSLYNLNKEFKKLDIKISKTVLTLLGNRYTITLQRTT